MQMQNLGRVGQMVGQTTNFGKFVRTVFNIFILFLLFLRSLIFYHLFTLMYTVAVAKPGVVSNAAGSAYIEVGSTKVVAACYGKRRLWLLSLEIVFIYPTRLCLKECAAKCTHTTVHNAVAPSCWFFYESDGSS